MNGQDLEERVANIEQKLEFVVTRDELAEVLRSLHLRFDKIENRFDTLENRFDTLENRFDTLENRFDTLENRFDKLENRVDANSVRLDSLTAQFSSFRDEQRLANEASGKAWEKLDGQMAIAESDRERLFIKLDSIQTALENHGISVN